MLRPLRCIALIGLLLTMATLSGCPVLAPDLSVTPLALNFGVNENAKVLRIQNRGGGTLTWTAAVSEGAPWLSLELIMGKQAQTVEGQSTTEIDTVGLNVNRTLLGESTSRQAAVVITSDGGSQTVNVSVSEAGPAELQISPTSLAFGSMATSLEATIGNGGFEALSWSLAIPQDAPWLTASPTQNSSVLTGSADAVTFTVNRTGLPGGDYQAQVAVASNGGSGQITVTMSVPPLIVSTDALDFGSLIEPATRTLTITNPSDAVVGVDLSTVQQGTNVEWFVISNPIVLIDPLDSVTLEVIATPVGLAPAEYTGSITVASPALNFSALVSVRMDVPGFSVTPQTIDFGEITATAQDSFVMENLTDDPLAFSIEIPSGHPWLTASPMTGTLAGTQTVQLTANPLAVDPNAYEAEVTINFGEAGSGLSEVVTVSMSRPEPARLEASPKSIVFGTSLIEKRVAIWNVGIGTVNWRIETAGFPNWLSLTPVDGSGVGSGTVSGDATDEVTLRVDRSQFPAGVFEVSHSFTIAGSGDASNNVTISLTATIAQVPVAVIEADDVDDRGNATLTVPIDRESRTLVIRNEGTGTLSWSFGALPNWITSISPSQGSLDANLQQTVTLTVSRTGLSAPGTQELVEVLTNDPNNEVLLLDVSISVPPVISITTRFTPIGFAEDENLEAFEIANDGDAGTILNYRVVSNQEWLSVSPSNGTSIGTSSPIKDLQPHSVSVDRSLLDGANASGRLIITAYRIENGVAVPDLTVRPVEVLVIVQAAPLTIESAAPGLRVPGLFRNLLMLRNVRTESIPIPNTRLDDIGNLFQIRELETVLELSETNQFLKKNFSANVLVVMDFSGSMLASAEAVAEDGQLGDPAALTEDALKTVYLRAIGSLLDELPANFRVGLGLFNDNAIPESGVVRMITPADGEPAFTRDKAVLQARLAGITVRDNGATDFLPAVEEAAMILQQQDLDANLRPFDSADMKAIVMVTDGRDTSLDRITESSTILTGIGARLFVIGWGEQVTAEPIVQLTTASGGHYYSTRARATGLQDPFGVPIRIPLVSELEDWCVLDPADECDESLPNDLGSQVLLCYTTLNQQTSVTVEADLTFNDPNDQNSVCLPEQGEISSGVAYRQLDYTAIQGDNRLGQVSLHTEGISNGEATIVVHADYVPRNIDRFSFGITVTSLESPSVLVTRSPQTAGGLIHNWDTGGAPPTYTFSSPDGEPIRFADFGDLLEIRVTNVTQSFILNFEILDPLYSAGNFETKYMTHPDSILVSAMPFTATSFPAPYFNSRPAPLDVDSDFIVDADSDTDQVEIDVFNLGGSHIPPGATPSPFTGEFSELGVVNVGLFWEAEIDPDSTFLSFQLNTPRSGFATSTFTPSTMYVNLDRSLAPPGEREGLINITYGSGSVNNTGTLDPLRVRYTVENPVFDISEPFINFGFTPDSQEVTLSNVGQSTLFWEVDPSAFPAWLDISSTAGTIGPDETAVFTISIIRANLPEGEQEYTIEFTADFADPITLTVAAEGLPPAP